MRLRMRIVRSPSNCSASGDKGSFSRSRFEAILMSLKIDFAGALRGVRSGNGYARYVAGFVILRVLVGDGEVIEGEIRVIVGGASSVNLTVAVEESVRRW